MNTMLVRNKNDGVHNVHNLCSLHHHMFVKKDGYIKSTGEKCIRKKYKELAMLCLSADNATVTGGTKFRSKTTVFNEVLCEKVIYPIYMIQPV